MAAIEKHHACVNYLNTIKTVDQETRDIFGLRALDYYDSMSCWTYRRVYPGLLLLASHFLLCPLLPICCTGCLDCQFCLMHTHDGKRRWRKCIPFPFRIPFEFEGIEFMFPMMLLSEICHVCFCCRFSLKTDTYDFFIFDPNNCKLCQSHCTATIRCCSAQTCFTCCLPSYSGKSFFNGYLCRNQTLRPPDWAILRCVSKYPFCHCCFFPMVQPLSLLGLGLVDCGIFACASLTATLSSVVICPYICCGLTMMCFWDMEGS
jgi:hypothetical protein